MPLEITGTGWVTSLGSTMEGVWNRLAAGDRPAVGEIGTAVKGRTATYIPTVFELEGPLARAARIRRASAITTYAVGAALAALENAGCEFTPTGALVPEQAATTAVIFAICSGGVNYTRRFYEKTVTEGPAGASPLLFPETVYNAPASHVAAVLGTDGITYTLVGDASSGLAAIGFSHELLATEPDLQQCLIVGTEECDWILWQSYAAWRLLAREPKVQLHLPRPKGTLLAEGASALVVRRATDRKGSGTGVTVAAQTSSYQKRPEAAASLRCLLEGLPHGKAANSSSLVIGSANGTWIDHAEAEALRHLFPGVPAFYPKATLGESLGASALMQIALGTEALRRNRIPGPIDAKSTEATPLQQVIVPCVGLNQQLGAAVLSKKIG